MAEGYGPLIEGMTGGSSLDALPFGIGPIIAEALEYIAIVIDLIGVSLILFGFVIAILRLLLGFREGVGFRRDLGGMKAARTVLGTYILTGLEFMIASDIVHTVITREFTDLLFVGLLVAIRTAISFFLGKEIAEVRSE